MIKTLKTGVEIYIRPCGQVLVTNSKTLSLCEKPIQR